VYDGRVRVSVVIDSVDPDALVPFWAAALGYRYVEQPGLDAFRALVPADGEPPGPVLILQRVPQARPPGKNRVHLDVHPPDVPELLDRLVALGARVEAEPVTELLESMGIWWQVVSDPEGNTLCVVADPGHAPPG
jgi:predicted enzyme related to lactoylglutathione lyase